MKKRKAIIKISTPKGNFEVIKFIKQIQEEEEHIKNKMLISKYEEEENYLPHFLHY